MIRKGFISGFTIILLLLQSCVSNYAVVSTQSSYNPETLMAEKSNFEPIKMDLEKDESLLSDDDIVIKAKKISKNNESITKKENTIDKILFEASSYIGTPYRLGGMTRSGIDCSAFVLSVYSSTTNINLPRVSSAQAQEGERVEMYELQKGDLLFFQTRGSRISHVGIVQDIMPDGEIKFIHASTSKGVIISSLNEKYWGARYRFAKRILTEEKLEEVVSL